MIFSHPDKMPPRLVRRQPLMQRISAAINPWDFLLWLSEEIETRELDSQTVGTQVGLAANFLFLLARANLGPSNSADDDVFGDASSHGWFSYLVSENCNVATGLLTPSILVEGQLMLTPVS